MALVDVMAGLHAAVGVLAALTRGEGGRVEVPLIDSALASLVNVAQGALVTGVEPERHGNAHPHIVPYEDFGTASGRLAVAAANDGLFRALCRALGCEQLADDPRFATNPARVEHRKALIPELQARFAERPAEEWVAELGAAGVPVGKVRSVRDALAATAAAGVAATRRMPHPTAGELEQVASPIWAEGPLPEPSAPPLLGQHTGEVLRELGRSAEQIATLAERGAVLLADEGR